MERFCANCDSSSIFDWDIDRGVGGAVMKHEKPSNQMAFPGLGDGGEAVMQAARDWIRLHWMDGAWDRMVELAHQQAKTGRISSKYLVESVRNERRVKIGNELTPAFSRILSEMYPELQNKFEFKASKCDVYTDVRF